MAISGPSVWTSTGSRPWRRHGRRSNSGEWTTTRSGPTGRSSSRLRRPSPRPGPPRRRHQTNLRRGPKQGAGQQPRSSLCSWVAFWGAVQISLPVSFASPHPMGKWLSPGVCLKSALRELSFGKRPVHFPSVRDGWSGSTHPLGYQLHQLNRKRLLASSLLPQLEAHKLIGLVELKARKRRRLSDTLENLAR